MLEIKNSIINMRKAFDKFISRLYPVEKEIKESMCLNLVH